MLDSGRHRVCEILNVNRDDLGPYAKVKVSLPDGTVVIRWGLDTLTYDHLLGVLSAQLEQGGAGSSYQLWLTAYSETDSLSKTSYGHIEHMLGNQWVRVRFGCSDRFLANLSWLYHVQSVAQLASLEWSHWTEAYQHLLDTDNIEQHGTQRSNFEPFAAERPSPLQWRRPVLFAVLAVAAFALLMGINVFVQWHRVAGLLSSRPFATSNPAQSPTGAHTTTAHPLFPPPSKSSSHQRAANQLDQTSTHLTSEGVGESSGAVVSQSSSPTSNVVYEVPAGEVALTFDDGPTPYTEGILAALGRYHAHATFFFIGKNALRFPDAVQDVAEVGDGIGDHSEDHHDMQKMTPDEQMAEIVGGRWDILQHADAPVELFRPPYESFNKTTERLVLDNHMVMALWNRDPKDWQATSPADVARRVLALPASGGVFDLHDTQNTMLALPTILQSMTQAHLKFVVLQPHPPNSAMHPVT